MPRIEHAFLLIAGFAFYKLWVTGLFNGMLDGLNDLTANGDPLYDGTKLRSSFSGIPGVDSILATLTGFWYEIIAKQNENPNYTPFLVSLWSTLSIIPVFQLAEAYRAGGNYYRFVAIPSISGLLGSYFGAGCVLPIYFFLHLIQPAKPRGAVSLAASRALLPAYLVGTFVPLFNAILREKTPYSLQSAIAGFQAYPAYSCILQLLLATVFATVSPVLPHTEPAQARKALSTVYLASAAIAASGHLYAIYNVLTSTISLGSLWIPYFLEYSQLRPTRNELSFFFLQYDWLAIAASSMLWAGILLVRDAQWSPVSTVGCFSVGACLFGPGAVVAMAMREREIELEGGSDKR